jgi:hypothetical protein
MASRQNPDGKTRDGGGGNRRSNKGSEERDTDAEAGTGSASELIRGGTRAIKEVGSYVGQQAAAEATRLGRRLGDESTRLLDRQKGAAAQEISQVGSAIRQAAGNLQGEHIQGLSQYVEAAAERVDKVSEYLNRQDLAGLAQDAERLARRQPAWFVGGMLVAGVVIGRFMKTAVESAQVQTGSPGRQPEIEIEAEIDEPEEAPRRKGKRRRAE